MRLNFWKGSTTALLLLGLGSDVMSEEISPYYVYTRANYGQQMDSPEAVYSHWIGELTKNHKCPYTTTDLAIWGEGLINGKPARYSGEITFAYAPPYQDGGSWHYCGYGKESIVVSMNAICPENTIQQNRGPNNNLAIVCQLLYVAAAPSSNPSTQCPVGNPIDTSTGAKIQKETDIYSRGINQVGYERTYNNGNKSGSTFWFNPYQRTLRIITPEKVIIGGKKSSPYEFKSDACTSGWNQIKSGITESWAQGTTAQYVNDICQVKRNNVVVRNLPILPNVNSLHIYLKPGSIQLVRENGSIFSFGLGTNHQYRELNGERGQLTAVSDSTPVVWRFKTNSGDVEDYNADGKLLSITASNGIKQELFYDAISGLLSRVKDSTNRELLFTYIGNQISSVTVDGNKTTSYTYNALGLITQVTRPDNTTRIYHYEDTRFPTALTGITDERGARYATWTYDAQGRAISSEHAGGAEKTLLAFNADGSTTVTNALNKQTIYRFDDIAGARRVTKVEGQPTTNCIGANQDYTYTPEGWIASKTDWKGIKTMFTYNTAGQEISRTEAFGTPEARTTTTEWHSTLFVKTKITEPGKETIYSYDVNGRLLNQSTNSISVQ